MATINNNHCDALITIGITAYNSVNTIERAIKSALSQDWMNYEVLVVDDGSTDGTYEILRERAATDSRLRVIQHVNNVGCAAARNSLIKFARGEFLAFFDDDDVSLPQRLKLQHECITNYERQSGESLIACYASGERIYPNGYKRPISAVGSLGNPPVGREMADYLLYNKRSRKVHYGAGTPTCALMARTRVFRELSGFDPLLRRQEDVDFAIRLGFLGGHFIGIKSIVLTQYSSTGIDKTNLVEYHSSMRILKKNARYLNDLNVYRYMRQWTLIRYYHFSGKDDLALRSLLLLLIIHPQRTFRHFLISSTRRFIHEKRMKKLRGM